MKDNIRNTDKQGKRHGVQIEYHPNGNIRWICNYNHSKANGYIGWFKSDKTTYFKLYFNMGNKIYDENHLWSKQIEIYI